MPLTRRGKATAVVQDAEAYHRLLLLLHPLLRLANCFRKIIQKHCRAGAVGGAVIAG